MEGEVFDVTEGESLNLFISTDGFSYGGIPLTVSFITYSDYMEMGFNLTDDFDLDDIPTDAAQGMRTFMLGYYQHTDTNGKMDL